MNNGDDYNIDTDPEFHENFYKNIEKALNSADEDQKGTDETAGREKEEYPADTAEPSVASNIKIRKKNWATRWMMPYQTSMHHLRSRFVRN